MRVLVVANMYPTPDDPWFGCFVRDQVEDLRELGVDVDVLSFNGRERTSEYLRAIPRTRARLRASSYDLVHAHYGLTGAAVALGRPRSPQVTTFHGTDYSGPAWQRLMSRAVARRSTCIVVQDEGRTRLSAPHAAVIPMGVDTQHFRPIDRAEARRRLGWEPDAHYALLAGSRLNPFKRADLFDAALEVARQTVPDLRPAELHGLDRDGVLNSLNAADVVVVTSDHEGSPLAVREALACTTPVVSVTAGDVPAVIAGLPGCAVVERTPAAIAGAIVEAISAERSSVLRDRAELTSRATIAKRVRDVYTSAT
jgi:glycosyltransferase involved in cell wall biosynthesis